MEKRILIAVIFSFILIFFYNMFVMEKYNNPVSIPELKEDTGTSLNREMPQNENFGTVLQNTETSQKTSSLSETSVVSYDTKLNESILSKTVEERKILKVTKKYTLQFSNKGACITNIYLNEFKYISTSDTLDFTDYTHRVLNENILLTDMENNGELSKVNFEVLNSTDTSISFEYKTAGYYLEEGKLVKSFLPSGMTVIKSFEISDDSYLIKLKLKILKPDNSNIDNLSNIQITNPETNEKYISGLSIKWTSGIFIEHDKPNIFVYYQNESFEKENPGSGFLDTSIQTLSLKNNDEIYKKFIQASNIKWFGLNSNYFLTAMMVDNIPSNRIELYSTKTNVGYRYLTTPLQFDKNSIDLNFNIFVGPKEYYLLKSVMPGKKLEESMDYGWFGALALLLLKVLKFFYNIIPNYGAAIILLTILINVIMYPLKAKSMNAMEEMKKLQPKIQELKEKYGDDKTKIQQETMRLYKEYKINPLGGCLPMLLQLPIFIGLYRMLEYAIELRGAVFFYIRDLSAADPTYILPIIMGGTMFIQQKLTPAPPEQQKTMMILPFIFTFMFLRMPAGLILYWTAFNIISILQQLYQNKLSAKKGVK
ncbi:membrane protein insertase YidC [Candidatus Dependentiae bacterium]|nr:membrane protein insertase YidC [Candidatus Dependentiae bacterium]